MRNALGSTPSLPDLCSDSDLKHISAFIESILLILMTWPSFLTPNISLIKK